MLEQAIKTETSRVCLSYLYVGSRRSPSWVRQQLSRYELDRNHVLMSARKSEFRASAGGVTRMEVVLAR